MSIIDLNMLGLLISDLNKEICYKMGEDGLYDPSLKHLSLSSDGEDHCILLLDEFIWCSKLEKEMEDIPIETEMSLNERENFEVHLRLLINDKINKIKNLEM